jgi:hypothetical protein
MSQIFTDPSVTSSVLGDGDMSEAEGLLSQNPGQCQKSLQGDS